MFSWLFIIMAVVILILIIVVIWLAATKQSATPTPTTQGFNSSFNQVDYSGISGFLSQIYRNYMKNK
jgi:preprotein translocase subunit SecG